MLNQHVFKFSNFLLIGSEGYVYISLFWRKLWFDKQHSLGDRREIIVQSTRMKTEDGLESQVHMIPEEYCIYPLFFDGWSTSSSPSSVSVVKGTTAGSKKS